MVSKGLPETLVLNIELSGNGVEQLVSAYLKQGDKEVARDDDANLSQKVWSFEISGVSKFPQTYELWYEDGINDAVYVKSVTITGFEEKDGAVVAKTR